MGGDSATKAYPQVVKLDTALKLAEAWVNNMSGSTETESNEVEFEGRPSRLGLGAKVSRHVELADSNDPVERKLIGKFGSMKRRSAKNLEESNPAETSVQSDKDDDEHESRTNAFAKKRATFPPSSSQAKKRQK